MGVTGCVLSSVATDVLVLKHQAISIYSADQISTALDKFQTKYHIHSDNNIRKLNEVLKKKNYPVVQGLILNN